MKVLYSSQAVVEYDGKHYYNNAIQSSYKRYVRQGDDLTIVCHLKEVETPSQNMIDDNQANFIFVKKTNRLYSFYSDARNNKRIVTELVKKTDMCFVNVPCQHSTQIISAAKAFGKPYMTIVVGCPWDAYWNFDWRGKIVAPFAYLSLRWIQNQAPYSLYVTQLFLQRRYPTRGKHLGCSDVDIRVDDDIIIGNRIKRIDRIIADKSVLKIGTVAAVDVPFKGQKYVIKALAELKKKGICIEYHLAGKGSHTVLETIAKKLGVANQLFFHGAIPHSEVMNFLDGIDIYIQPSKQEGLPRALVEAMSRGCLCFGSNIAGIPELLDDDYLFPKGDVHKIAKQLESISSDSLREQAKRNFDIAKSYDHQILDQRRAQFISEFYNLCRPE